MREKKVGFVVSLWLGLQFYSHDGLHSTQLPLTTSGSTETEHQMGHHSRHVLTMPTTAWAGRFPAAMRAPLQGDERLQDLDHRVLSHSEQEINNTSVLLGASPPCVIVCGRKSAVSRFHTGQPCHSPASSLTGALHHLAQLARLQSKSHLLFYYHYRAEKRGTNDLQLLTLPLFLEYLGCF